MEKKLELKHLVGYLPYKLKAEMLDYKSDYVGKQFDTVIGFHQWDSRDLYWSALTIGGSKPELNRIKPILRPLSDLTKEIEVNGEKFVPIVKLAEINLRQFNWKMVNNSDRAYSEKLNCEFYFNGIDFRVVNQNYDGVATKQFQLFQKLFEWHFDFQNLIENRLAIDVNTLQPTQPSKT